MMKAVKTVLKKLKDAAKKIKDKVVPKFSRPLDRATNALGVVQGSLDDYSTLIIGLTTL